MAHAAGLGAGDLHRLAEGAARIAHRDGDPRVMARHVDAPRDSECAPARGADHGAATPLGLPGRGAAADHGPPTGCS